MQAPLRKPGRELLFLLMMGVLAAAAAAQQGQTSAPSPTSGQTPGQTPNQSGGKIEPQVWPPPQGQPQAVPPAQVPAAPVNPRLASGPAPGVVRLNVVVTDKSGKPVSGLTQSDFTLLDNNKPREIAGFHAYNLETHSDDPPAQIVIAIDETNIGFLNVSSSRYEIGQFLKANGGKLTHPVSLVWVTDVGLKLIVSSSLDGNAMAAQLDAAESQLRTLRRSAGAWGAIERFQISLQMLEQIMDSLSSLPGRKELIWIGPGWPMFDDPRLQLSWKDQQNMFRNIVEMNTRLREGQIALYSVTMGVPNPYTFLYESFLKGVKKPSQAYPTYLDLKVIAVGSGGNVLPPDNDLARAVRRCVEDADAYYAISFIAPPADGPDEYHELKIKVDKPGLTARTNTGYYNQPR